MPQHRTTRRPSAVRRAARHRALAHRPIASSTLRRTALVTASGVSRSGFEAARRIAESVIVAAVGSAVLYLVGSVYVDAYYGRMSIEATSLDFAPSYIALQSIHALQGLLEYPSTLLLLYVLYRTFSSPARRLRAWFEQARQRFPRLLLVVANLVVVAPLLIGAALTSYREGTLVPGSVLAEVAILLENAGLILLVYAVWLGWSQRAFIVSQIQARKLVPIALVFIVYVLNALAATATSAEMAAELLMTGRSDGSMSVAFTMRDGAEQPLAGKDLILVTTRNDTFYVVERQPDPPSQRPMAYMVPVGTVDVATVRRLTDADAAIGDFMIDVAE